MKKKKVLLCCASDWAAPARLPRVLKRAGLEVHALSAAGRALLRTRFVDVTHDAPESLPEYVELLRAHLLQWKYDWILIVDDPLLSALAERRDQAWLDGILPMTGEWGAALASKAGFCKLGAAGGLPIPPSRACESRDELYAAVESIGLPVMVKESAGFAGLGVRAVRSVEQVEPAWRALAGASLVVQRFLDGPIGNTVVLYDRGTPLTWMSAYKVRTWPGPFGPSSARTFMNHAEVAPLVHKVGALTGYHGFCALDWVHAADHLSLIELNARPVPTIHMGPLAGVDFSHAVRELLAGSPVVRPPPDPPGDAPVVPMFPEDVWRAASDGELSLLSWLPRPGRPNDVPWSDPALILHHLRRLVRAGR